MHKSLFSTRYGRFLALLKQARMAAGLSQTEAARRLGRPQSFVSKCESGERRVDIVELLAFCEAYGKDPMEFVTEFLQAKKR